MDDKNTTIDTKDKVIDEKENLRVQKAEYIRRQLEKQRQAEDTRLEQMMQEQRMIDALQKSMDDSMEGTAESRKYNREFQERINAQVYAMHGLSVDKLQGMKEYKRACYKGGAAALFLLSLVLVVLCGVLQDKYGKRGCRRTIIQTEDGNRKEPAAPFFICYFKKR